MRMTPSATPLHLADESTPLMSPLALPPAEHSATNFFSLGNHGDDDAPLSLPRGSNASTHLSSENAAESDEDDFVEITMPEGEPINKEKTIQEKQVWDSFFDKANFGIFGIFYGAFYALTSLAGGKETGGTVLGAFAAIASGITNIFQVPQATRRLFRFDPVLWITTAILFPLVGGYAVLPFLAALLKSTGIIGNTDTPSDTLNSILGNTAFLTGGVTYTLGLTNQLNTLLAYFMWFYNHDKKYLFVLMRNYLNSQARTIEELNNFSPDEIDKFFTTQLTLKNIASIPFALAAGVFLAYSIAPEIPKALQDADQYNIKTMGMLLNKGRDFAGSDQGSKLMTILTYGLLNASFAYDSVHAIPRDIQQLTTAPNKFKSLSTLLSYISFILLTCLTGALQSKEAGANTIRLLASTLCVAVINWCGPRRAIFEKLLPWLHNTLSEHFPTLVDKPNDHPVTLAEDTRLHYARESDARKAALDRLDQAEALYFITLKAAEAGIIEPKKPVSTISTQVAHAGREPKKSLSVISTQTEEQIIEAAAAAASANPENASNPVSWLSSFIDFLTSSASFFRSNQGTSNPVGAPKLKPNAMREPAGSQAENANISSSPAPGASPQ